MLIFLWIAGMLLSFFMTALIYRRDELIRLITVSQSFYYSFYIVVSGILIWLEEFSILRGAAVTLLTELVVVLIVGITVICRRPADDSVRFGIAFSVKKFIPLAILLIAGAFLVHEKAGIFGTGQDQGLYQIRAMMYMGGYNDNIVDFPEYYTIENSWEKGFYQQEVADMVGLYLLKEDNIEGAGEVNGVLHGIATFPALLGLWGSIFGLSHLPGIMTVLYLLALANVWLIGDNLKFKPWVNTVITAYMAVCPIIIWSAKQTLTEMGFTMMFCAFLELLTENTKKKVYFWSVIPLLAACYYHVILTVVIPLLVILYFTNYLQSKKRGFLGAVIVLMIGYATGYSMMQATALHYTMKNFEQLFRKTHNLLNEDNVEIVIWIAASLVIVAAVVMWQRCVRRAVFTRWNRIRKSVPAKRAAAWGIRGLTILLIVFFIYKGIKAYRMDMWPMKLSVLGYLFMTGYIMVPAMVLGLWQKAGKVLRNRNIVTITLSIFYIMVFYCAVLWVLLYYYYYYARYLAPFVVLILLMGGYCLNRFRWPVGLPVCIAMAGLMIWQSRLLYTDQDLTYVQYSQMEAIVSAINQNDASGNSDESDALDTLDTEKNVILVYEQGYHIQRIFALALKGMTGADILYLNYDRLEEQLTECSEKYDDIYLLQYDTGRINDQSGGWTYLIREGMQSSIYDSFVEQGLPYAKEAVVFESPLALLKYNR